MSEAVNRRLEAAAYVAVILFALTGTAVLVDRFFLRPAGRQASAVGKTVAVPGVDWKSSGRTIVLVLSSTCHFCSESAPFYRRLVERAHAGPTRVLAMLPQPAAEGNVYLKSLGVPLEARQVFLPAIHVRATPTILLVNARGVVEKEWRGQLPSSAEVEVMEAAGGAIDSGRS